MPLYKQVRLNHSNTEKTQHYAVVCAALAAVLH